MSSNTSSPVILVTGCSSGIGRATALRLANDGCDVIAGVRRPEDAKRLQAESSNIHPTNLDVTVSETITETIRLIDDRFGRLDGLVNNAGVAVAGPLELVPQSEWRRQYEVNVFGVVRMVQASLPHLRKSNGRIINIGSAASRLALPMLGTYASSKYAVAGLSDALRRELRSFNIRVIVICPGQTATPIFEKSEREAVTRLESIPDDTESQYAATLERFQQLLHNTGSARCSPDRVATAVAKGLFARRPRVRYHVGWDAKASALVDRFVPAAFVDWMIERQLRVRDRS